MDFPSQLLNTMEFRRNIGLLKQTEVSFSEESKSANRFSNLTALIAGWTFSSLPYPISEICAGRVPVTISSSHMAVINIIKAYDFMAQDSRLSDAWNMPNAELLFKLALMIESRRYEYGFLPESMLQTQCRHVTGFQGQSEWQHILLPYMQWKFYEKQLSWPIGIASVICILAKIFRLAPNVLPYCDFSSVIKSIYGPVDNQYVDRFANTLQSNIYLAIAKVHSLRHQKQQEAVQASQTEQQKPDTVLMSLMPILELLADGNARSGKAIMTTLGIAQRPLFANTFLKPAIEKQLVEPTETNPNSPKQQYRLSDNGRRQLQLSRGIIA